MFQKIVQCDKFYDQRQLISPVDAKNWILIAWRNQVDIKYSQTASMHCNARYYPESASQLRLSSKPQSCAHRMEYSDVIWTSCTPTAINSCRKVFITPVDTARITATATRRDWTCSSQLQWVSDRRRQSQYVARVSHTKRFFATGQLQTIASLRLVWARLKSTLLRTKPVEMLYVLQRVYNLFI